LYDFILKNLNFYRFNSLKIKNNIILINLNQLKSSHLIYNLNLDLNQLGSNILIPSMEFLLLQVVIKILGKKKVYESVKINLSPVTAYMMQYCTLFLQAYIIYHLIIII